jgi:DNA-binding NarL/FixJ family response regulator
MEERARMIRVLMGDTSPLFLRGARATVEEQADMELAGAVAENQDLLTVAMLLNPDVIIYGTAQSNGAAGTAHDLTRALHLQLPNTAVILFSEEEDEEELFKAVKAGASAFLLKTTNTSEFLDTVRRVATGEHVIDDVVLTRPSMASKVLNEFSTLTDDTPQEIRPLFAPLSPREIEILEQICRGSSNKLIARTLSISEQTVKNHITSILKKLAVNDRTEAVIYSLRRGWITVDALGQ